MLSYKDAGVDINAGNELVEKIKPLVKSTYQNGVMQNIGGFGALFELPTGYQEPVLVSGTDGVGTKLKLALEMQSHQTIGIDLVAMCVNDLIVQGAKPLFFLDYYATSSLDVSIATDVIKGITTGCVQAQCALIGGETAEMPGIYAQGDYDLAGFCTGIVEKSQIIDGKTVQEDDIIIGIASSGAHSNGYSLIRKIIDLSKTSLQYSLDSSTLGELLLSPTKIYVKSILELLKSIKIKAIAHITGGGLVENIPRILPNHSTAKIDLQSWQQPVLFDWLQKTGKINNHEMLRTFNCGIGMVLVVDKNVVDTVINYLNKNNEYAWVIGHIENGKPGVIFQ